jgi:hypothetical protein
MSDWNFMGCGWDNTQLSLSAGAIVHVIGGHFENPDQISREFFTSSFSDWAFRVSE